MMEFGSPVATCLVLILALLVGHVFMLWWRADKKLWATADYLWIILAAMGLITATGDARKMIADAEASRVESRHEISMQAVRLMVDDRISMYQFRQKRVQLDIQEYGNSLDSGKDFGGVIAKLQALAEALKRTPYEPIRESLANYPNPLGVLDDDQVTTDNARLTKVLRSLEVARAELKQNRESREMSEWERTAKAFSPLLLALSLAILTTKTSAQLMGYT